MNAAAVIEPFWFTSGGDDLLALLHPAGRSVGVLIVVGGPQYRVGAHRSFVMFARAIAEAGFPVLRFDLPGMGDSSGAPRPFDALDAVLRDAIDTLSSRAGCRSVVIWGLCDAASAAMLYAATDPRVRGIVTANPWVRSAAGAARARLRGYYLRRLASPSFWAKLLRGRVRVGNAAAELGGSVTAARSDAPAPGFVNRMLDGWQRFGGETLLVISGQDLTAKEFVELCAREPRWAERLSRPDVTRIDLPDADHTFSSAAWRQRVATATIDWLHDRVEPA
ncbi:MAG: hydrolase 1, exosortase A system-associated [Chromatiales bacterium]|nr:hydrolase 1, exosortase A system-associated [Chromatiales bacterium]